MEAADRLVERTIDLFTLALVVVSAHADQPKLGLSCCHGPHV